MLKFLRRIEVVISITKKQQDRLKELEIIVANQSVQLLKLCAKVDALCTEKPIVLPPPNQGEIVLKGG